MMTCLRRISGRPTKPLYRTRMPGERSGAQPSKAASRQPRRGAFLACSTVVVASGLRIVLLPLAHPRFVFLSTPCPLVRVLRAGPALRGSPCKVLPTVSCSAAARCRACQHRCPRQVNACCNERRPGPGGQPYRGNLVNGHANGGSPQPAARPQQKYVPRPAPAFPPQTPVRGISL